MSMKYWVKRLDVFLEFNGTEILTDAGKISVEKAKLHAETEFEKYRTIQDRLFEVIQKINKENYKRQCYATNFEFAI